MDLDPRTWHRSETPGRGSLRRWGAIVLAVALGVALAAGVTAQGQAATTGVDDGARQAEPGPSPAPSIGELLPRVQDLIREAADARRQLAELGDVSELEREIDAIESEQTEVGDRVEQVLAHEYVRDDRVRRLLDRALFLQGRIDEAMEESTSRLQELGRLGSPWSARRDRWRSWRQERRSAEPMAEPVYDEQVGRALETIDGVLDGLNEALGPLVEVQERLQELDAANRDAVSRAEGVLQTWREMLFRATAPVLLSAEHREQLQAELVGEIRTGVAVALDEGFASSPREGGLLLMQIVLVLTLGWGLGRLRPKAPEGSRWAATLRHPWAIGVFVACTGVGPLYEPLPPLGRLLLGTALAGSAVAIASGLFANPAKRTAVYGVSAAFIALSALETVAMPVPVLRLILAGAVLLGVPAMLLLERRSPRAGAGGRLWFDLALYLGAVLFVLVLGAEVLGYHFLALWLFESAVVTAFVSFVATFLIRLARGGLDLAFRSDDARRVELLSRIGGLLSRRLLGLVKLFVVAAAGFYLLSVWDLAESPGQAWHSLVNTGLRVGSGEVTVGGLLLAALAVYLAVSVSWVLRLILDRTLFEHRRFERGVRDSISTLLHYSLIVVGGFLALSVLGFDLSSFALIAGALGVGVGFGLQNVVNNFVSGLILLFERPVRVDDRVVVGDQLGVITKIGLRSTVLTTFDGAELIIPNGDLISEKVVNWTLSTQKARLVFPVGVAYGNDPARVIELLEEVGRSLPESLDDPAPVAVLVRFGDSSLDFELRVWLDAYDQLFPARSSLATLVHRRLLAEGVEIPFPQRDVHLKEGGRTGGRSTNGPGEVGDGSVGDETPPPETEGSESGSG